MICKIGFDEIKKLFWCQKQVFNLWQSHIDGFISLYLGIRIQDQFCNNVKTSMEDVTHFDAKSIY